MDVFKAQKKIFKYCGIERFSSPRMRNLLFAMKTCNLLAMSYCVFTAVLFACSTKDIREIAESMSPGFTGFIMIIKYTIFCIQTEKIFKIMYDIQELSEECKIFCCIGKCSALKFLLISNSQTNTSQMLVNLYQELTISQSR